MLRFSFQEHKVLLTGTPLQNNVEELFALLSFLQPETFNSQQAFSLEFGNLKDNAQVAYVRNWGGEDVVCLADRLTAEWCAELTSYA